MARFEWAKTYQSSSFTGYPFALDQASDGGYILEVPLAGAKSALLLLKLDQNGNIQWQKAYNGLSYYEATWGESKTYRPFLKIANGYLLLAQYEGQALIMKLDSDGNINDSDCPIEISSENVTVSDVKLIEGDFVDSYADVTNEITVNSNNSVEVRDAGFSEEEVCYSDIVSSWLKTYGWDGWDEAYAIQKTLEGGYIVAGNSIEDIFLMKVSSNGTVEWFKTYGGDGWDEAYSVQEATGGGYIAVGAATSFW